MHLPRLVGALSECRMIRTRQIEFQQDVTTQAGDGFAWRARTCLLPLPVTTLHLQLPIIAILGYQTIRIPRRQGALMGVHPARKLLVSSKLKIRFS